MGSSSLTYISAPKLYLIPQTWKSKFDSAIYTKSSHMTSPYILIVNLHLLSILFTKNRRYSSILHICLHISFHAHCTHYTDRKFSTFRLGRIWVQSGGLNVYIVFMCKILTILLQTLLVCVHSNYFLIDIHLSSILI